MRSRWLKISKETVLIQAKKSNYYFIPEQQLTSQRSNAECGQTFANSFFFNPNSWDDCFFLLGTNRIPTKAFSMTHTSAWVMATTAAAAPCQVGPSGPTPRAVYWVEYRTKLRCFTFYWLIRSQCPLSYKSFSFQSEFPIKWKNCPLYSKGIFRFLHEIKIDCSNHSWTIASWFCFSLAKFLIHFIGCCVHSFKSPFIIAHLQNGSITEHFSWWIENIIHQQLHLCKLAYFRFIKRKFRLMVLSCLFCSTSWWLVLDGLDQHTQAV